MVLNGCGKNEREPLTHDVGAGTTNPEYVYVPSENVVSKVVVKANSVADVGDWVELNATRDTSGKWLKVKRAELSEGAQWYSSIPNGFEMEVAANLSWKVDPPENYRFNVASMQNIYSLNRSVMFSKPGTYTLQGYSAFPIRSISNVIEIKVE